MKIAINLSLNHHGGTQYGRKAINSVKLMIISQVTADPLQQHQYLTQVNGVPWLFNFCQFFIIRVVWVCLDIGTDAYISYISYSSFGGFDWLSNVVKEMYNMIWDIFLELLNIYLTFVAIVIFSILYLKWKVTAVVSLLL